MSFHIARTPHDRIWTYGYAFTPPIACDRIGPLEALLDAEHSKAGSSALIWEGRLINGGDITHILVVSDRPDQDLEINDLLEAELDRLGAPFVITRAVAIPAPSGLGGTAPEVDSAPRGDI